MPRDLRDKNSFPNRFSATSELCYRIWKTGCVDLRKMKCTCSYSGTSQKGLAKIVGYIEDSLYRNSFCERFEPRSLLTTILSKRHWIVVNSYWHRTNDLLTESSKTNYQWITAGTTDNLTNNKRLFNSGNRRIETHQWHNESLSYTRPITSRLNWPIRSITK